MNLDKSISRRYVVRIYTTEDSTPSYLTNSMSSVLEYFKSVMELDQAKEIARIAKNYWPHYNIEIIEVKFKMVGIVNDG